MMARSKSITTIEFKMNVPQETTEKSVLHTLRIRNIALSTPQSYSLRDAVTIDVSFEIDPFTPLALKDISGNQFQFSRHNHCQYLKLPGEISVPKRLDSEFSLPSLTKFIVQNTSSYGLRLTPTLSCIESLQGILGVTLKRHEEGNGFSSQEGEADVIDLSPGDSVKLSIEISSYQSSRVVQDLLTKLENSSYREDVATQEDHGDDSGDELDDNGFERLTIGPILLTKILLKFSPFVEQSATWPSLFVDGKTIEPSPSDEISLDIIGSIVLSPTSVLLSTQSSPHSIEYSATLSDGNMRSGIFWKCQPLNLPLQILNPLTSVTLHNPSQLESKFQILSSQMIAVPEGNGKLADFSKLTCENIHFKVSPTLPTLISNESVDVSLEYLLEGESGGNDDLEEDISDLFDRLLQKYLTLSQKANATHPSTILAIVILACFDLTCPLHPPLIRPVFVKLVAEPQDDHFVDSIYSPVPLTETPLSLATKETDSKIPPLSNLSIPKLFLRGVSPCLPYLDQYEINLGQQFQNTDSTDWTLSFENLSTETKLRYRISTLSPDDSQWISLAQSGGVINPSGTASLILYFSLRQVGVFATYLIIENLTNPSDTCVIRTSVQVVQDWRRRNIFSEKDDENSQQKDLFLIESSQILRDPGLFRETILSWNSLETTMNRRRAYIRSPPTIDFSNRTTQVIDFGQVFIGQRYTRRSFVIVNQTDITLDFQLSSNISPRELSFSLTPVSPRTCCVVSVQPKERRFIYVIFRPLTRDVTATLSREEQRENSLEDNLFGTSQKFSRMEGSIFVSCNLVKNHHETIKVYAHCGLRLFGAFAIKRLNLFPSLGVGGVGGSGDEDDDQSILQISVPEHNDLLGVDNLAPESISAVEGTSLFAGTDYSWHSVGSISIRMVDTTPLQIRIYSCMKSFRLEVYRALKSDGLDQQLSEYQQLELLPLVWARGGGENGGTTVDFEITSPSEEFIIRVMTEAKQDLCSLTETSRQTKSSRGRYARYCIAAEDHFMIYNRASPIEKCRVPVRLLLRTGLACSDSNDDDPGPSAASSVGSTLSFSGLEGIIISYFKEFSRFWSDVLSLTNESVIARSDLAQQHSFLFETSVAAATAATVSGTNQLMLSTNNFLMSMTEHSQNNDYLTYGSRSGTDILTSLEYFFVRLKYCLHITETGMVLQERHTEYLRAYPEEEDLFPLLTSLASRYLDMCFHFGAITDLIVLYSMRQSSFGHEIMTAAHSGLPVARLALLFYSIVFRHPAMEVISRIPPDYRREGIGATLSVPLYPFAKQLLYYGSFFSHFNVTDGNRDHNPLVDILNAVKASFIDLKT
jgi:hypothetical protein